MSYPIEKHFKNSDVFLKLLQTKREEFWIKRGDKYFFELFNKVYREVPAYKKYLRKRKFGADSISSTQEISMVPLTSKMDYLKAYPLSELTSKSFYPKGNWVFSATSGSTGEPYYFPRTVKQDLYYALTAEMYLRNNFEIEKKRTLYINGFALGIWIGGIFTYQAVKHILEKNKFDLSLISSGANKEEMFKTLKKLYKDFDQVIIGGYPPFVKDFVDYSIGQGFDWSKIEKGFVFSAEGFSEDFRDYIAKNANIKNIYKDTLNHYGTVEIGTQSYETPICVLIRRLALKNKKFYKLMFGYGNRLPTLTQYIPEQFFFEEVNGNLICTSESGLPLIRYDLKDFGGVKKFNEVIKLAKDCEIDLKEEIKKAKIEKTVWELPFVYVFERADSSVSMSGANIYPENIKPILLNAQFRKYCTGRFAMEVVRNKKQEQTLILNIEVMPVDFAKKPFTSSLKKAIFERLISVNTEYNYIYTHLGRKTLPKIFLREYGDKKYFNRKGKQRWVIK